MPDCKGSAVLGLYERLDKVVRCPRVEELILQRLIEGPVISLFKLAVCDLGVSYWWAWTIIRRLELTGRVKVVRRPGQPLIISLKDD
jgi:hypothetical protein